MANWFLRAAVALLFFAPLACAVEVIPQADAKRAIPFGLWVEISPEGRVTEAMLPADSSVPSILGEALVRDIESRTFEPSRVDGEARASRSWLQGNMQLTPSGDDYEVAVEPTHLGPRPLRVFRPRPGGVPDAAIRLLLEFEVTAEGRVRDVRTLSLDAPPTGFIKGIEGSLEAMRFEPEQVDGRPVATTLRWPFQMRRDTTAEKPFELPPLARDALRPGVPGQDAYGPPIVFTAVRR